MVYFEPFILMVTKVKGQLQGNKLTIYVLTGQIH